MNEELFFSESPGYHHATLYSDFGRSTKWQIYTVGYRLAADTLVTRVIEEDANHDTLIYPIVFLYRHYFELRLKDILQQAGLLLEEEIKLPTHHDLLIIWTDVRNLLYRIWPETTEASIRDIESVLRAIGNVDKKSDSFRYPISTRGDANLAKLSKIDIIVFSDKVTPAIENLEGVSFGINSLIEQTQEMKQAFKDLRDFDRPSE